MGLFLVFVLLLLLCILAAFLITRPKRPAATPQVVQPVVPVVVQPVTPPPPYYVTYFPIVEMPPRVEADLPDMVTLDIWKVTSFVELGYELAGKRYDMATFTRVGSPDTVRGYCIDAGLAVPIIGTEYMRTAGEIMVPVQQPAADPFQRFAIIQ